MTNAANTLAPGKKPLDPRLFSGPMGTADDVRVQTGYPVWNLIEHWMVANYNDAEVIAGYSDMPQAEWEAAKRYYQDHKPFIDARIIANSQPAADDDVPALQTADDYFAWLAQRGNGQHAATDQPIMAPR